MLILITQFFSTTTCYYVEFIVKTFPYFASKVRSFYMPTTSQSRLTWKEGVKWIFWNSEAFVSRVLRNIVHWVLFLLHTAGTCHHINCCISKATRYIENGVIEEVSMPLFIMLNFFPGDNFMMKYILCCSPLPPI